MRSARSSGRVGLAVACVWAVAGLPAANHATAQSLPASAGQAASRYVPKQQPDLEALLRSQAAPGPTLTPDDGLRLFLTLDKLEFAPEEPFFVTVTAVNTSERDLEVLTWFERGVGTAEYVIHRAGEPVQLRSMTWDGPFRIRPRLLRPRQRWSERIDLSYEGLGDQTAPPAGPAASPSSPIWQPGKYEIVLTFDRLWPKPGQRAWQVSNAVGFTVLSPEQCSAEDRSAHDILGKSRNRFGSLLGILPQQIPAVREVCSKYPGCRYAAQALYCLAERLYYDGAHGEAFAVLATLPERYPGHPVSIEVQRHYARLLAEQGRLEEGRQAYLQLATDPEMPDGVAQSAFYHAREIAKAARAGQRRYP